MKISKKQGNVIVLDIGKTHVKVILFDIDKVFSPLLILKEIFLI